MPSASALRQLALRTTALLAASGSIAFAAGCGSGSSSSGRSSSGGSVEQFKGSTGKEIFNNAGCVSCHTLAAAGGEGNIGPNLDQLKPSKDTVASTVKNGNGRMPSFDGRLSSEQINTVADYIASVAGQ